MTEKNITAVIPVYKNTEAFLAALSDNRSVLKKFPVVIANDDPETKLTEPVNKIITAMVLETDKNRGFSANVNRAVSSCKTDFILLLNADVRFTGDPFEKLLTRFDDPDLFAVGFSQIEKNGNVVGANKIYFEKGLVNHAHVDLTVTGLTAWTEGGAMLFRRREFLRFGGFDEIYDPFYWEDVDLGYRALKNGLRLEFTPDIKVFHEHETTIGRYFEKKTIEEIAFRNQLIFTWKNIGDRNLVTEIIFNLPRYIRRPGFLSALKKIPDLIKSRRRQKKLWVKSDRDILKLFDK